MRVYTTTKPIYCERAGRCLSIPAKLEAIIILRIRYLGPKPAPTSPLPTNATSTIAAKTGVF